ncbi:MAG: acyl-CoA dehydrogenase family protein [Bacillota bacterium]
MDLRLTEEQLLWKNNVRRLMEEHVAPRAAQIDAEEKFPEDVKELFAKNGFFRTVVPVEYGGMDGKLLTLCLTIEEVNRICSASSIVLGNQSLGSAAIVIWGNEEQRSKYLPGIASGELLACFALTEPNAGSDVGAMQTRAVADGDDYVINGNKIFITHANVADVVTVFAKVNVDGKDRVTAFLVDKGTPGMSIGNKEKKMGFRGSSTCEVIFEDVRVHKSTMVGKIGDGFRIALDALDKGRIMVGGMATGLAQGALDAAVAYVRERSGLARQQTVQFALADMETAVQASRALNYTAAWKYDNKEKDHIRFSAMTKLYATAIVMDVTASAVQLLGHDGCSKNYPVERYMRDAKIFAIFEGTNEIQRLVIARDLLGN